MDRGIDTEMDRWKDSLGRQIVRQVDRWIDGWLDGWIDGQIDRQTDRSLSVLNRSIHGQVLQTKWKKQADGQREVDKRAAGQIEKQIDSQAKHKLK